MTAKDMQQCEIPQKIQDEILPALKPAGVRSQIVAGYYAGIAWAVAVNEVGDIDDRFAMAMDEADFDKLEAGFRAIGAVCGAQQADAALASMAPASKAIN